MQELKKEWEIKFDKLFDHIATFGVNAGRQEYKSFISSLLAKQQEEFVKCLPEEKHYKSQIPDDNDTIKEALDRKDIEYLIYAWQNQLTDVHNKVIADIKSKLNKNQND